MGKFLSLIENFLKINIENLTINIGPIHLKLKNKKDRKALGYFLSVIGIGLFVFSALTFGVGILVYIGITLLFIGSFLINY